MALGVGHAVSLKIEDIKPKHLVSLGEAHGLTATEIAVVIRNLDLRRPAAERAIRAAAERAGAERLGDDLNTFMERRWNGSFASTGTYLVPKKPSGSGLEDES